MNSKPPRSKRPSVRAFWLIALLVPLSGCLYTNIRRPRAYRSATPLDVRSSANDPTTRGESCLQSAVFLFSWGDASYAKATKAALKGYEGMILYDVKSDVKAQSYLFGIYTKMCTIVTGRVGRP